MTWSIYNEKLVKRASNNASIDKEVTDGVYDVNGFEIRFFSKNDIMGLMQGFIVDEIMEDTEDPANLYLVFCRNFTKR